MFQVKVIQGHVVKQVKQWIFCIVVVIHVSWSIFLGEHENDDQNIQSVLEKL